MQELKQNPRILIVTPEITYLPKGMGNIANYLTAKAGGMADVSAALISALYDQGADVHVAIPDYRALFHDNFTPLLKKELNTIQSRVPDEHIHLAEDRAFFYQNRVYSDYASENIKISLAFQREVINNIIPRVQPDLIHCNDWMTGLIPAMAREMGVPSLFTVHNIHTVKTPLHHVEDRGIDAAEFWHYLYFDRVPVNYEETREYNSLDFLTSGIFASHFVNTVSPTFLQEVVNGNHHFVPGQIRHELANKWYAGCAVGILNAPDPSFDPLHDKALKFNFDAESFSKTKKKNKQFLQKAVGLLQDPGAPLFFWPHRLDNTQKGCQLLADILYDVVSRYWQQHIQIIFVANGEYESVFNNIVDFHDFHDRVAICRFNEALARLAYGASDFILMPSRFEPCGLPQMIAPIYGALPVAHNTGGIHDTVTHLDTEKNIGNGFLFDFWDSQGLSWAIDQAMTFYRLPQKIKVPIISRIMTESRKNFNHDVTAGNYIALYEKMLRRPLVD